MPASPLTPYKTAIEQHQQTGHATEETHRGALQELIEWFDSDILATNEPRHVACGAPDFLISRKTRHGPEIVGYLETKAIGLALDQVERSEQLRRYRASLDNLILTDYLEFRWYVNGELQSSARLGTMRKDGKIAVKKDGPQAVTQLLSSFLDRVPEAIFRPSDLALRMARLTHLIRDIIVEAFNRQQASSTLSGLRKAFAQTLIPDLEAPDKTPEFADMFAQTLAYGLFAARCNHTGEPGTFRRLGAAAEIPKTNPFLRNLFDTITGIALNDEPFVALVDDLTQLLGRSNIEAVLADFGKRAAKQDPVVHFYETFLAAYDPKLREARGVYYTPEPVVTYIVRSVDHLLKTRFNCPDGLADTQTVEFKRTTTDPETGGEQAVAVTSPRVLILDPACGTGTFLYAAVDHIRDQFVRRKNAGMWAGYVKQHLLPRLFGFELLMNTFDEIYIMDLHGNAKKKETCPDGAKDENVFDIQQGTAICLMAKYP